jgi:DNA-binding GntR family transcriptional regulator
MTGPQQPQASLPETPGEVSGSLTDQAYRRIEELIVTLRLQPGEVLSESALSAMLGIGRTPIREAIQRLAGEGLVTVLPRKGLLVSDINPRRQLLLLEVRREIERLLARKAAVRQTAEERAEFLTIAAGMEAGAERQDDISFMRLDSALNRLIARAGHNEYAARAMRSLQGLSRRFWYMHYREAADLPLCARLHAEQARSIALGDPERAAAATDRLMDYVETFTRATIGELK